MSGLRGPAAKHMASLPVSERQLAAIRSLMWQTGISTQDAAWPRTVELLIGPGVSTDPAQWNRYAASQFIGVLRQNLGLPEYPERPKAEEPAEGETWEQLDLLGGDAS